MSSSQPRAGRQEVGQKPLPAPLAEFSQPHRPGAHKEQDFSPVWRQLSLSPDSKFCTDWGSNSGWHLPCDLQLSLPRKGFTSPKLRER